MLDARLVRSCPLLLLTTGLVTARALFEARLAKEPANAALAAELADVLLIDTRWIALKPVATKMADLLLKKGIYVIGFSYPVVPQGKARIRVQVSAAHTSEELDYAAERFAETKKELGI